MGVDVLAHDCCLATHAPISGGDHTLVGIITFDTGVQFYNVRADHPPSMLVITDMQVMLRAALCCWLVGPSLVRPSQPVTDQSQPIIGMRSLTLGFDDAHMRLRRLPSADFWPLLSSLARQEVYAPMSSALLAKLSDTKQELQSLLHSIPGMFAGALKPESCGAAAIEVCQLTLHARVGPGLVWRNHSCPSPAAQHV